MATRQKLIEKIQRNPRNVSLEQFESLVNFFGHIDRGGRHPKAVIQGCTLPYKSENPVKSCYVLELLEILDNLNEKRVSRKQKIKPK
jgi:hypothetical protein